MKRSISNIGWETEQDEAVYALMQKHGFTGLEIAPTRIFPQAPYENLPKAALWKSALKSTYGFVVPSMQSIWFGQHESIFGTDEEREFLLAYTKKAIDFAAAIACKNLVFGCPKNRNLPDGVNVKMALPFFKELGDYAAEKGTVIGMEANPPIYNTNYMNDTKAAMQLIKEVNSKGFLLNLDVGTMLANEEDLSILQGKVHLINHVHISEPWLKPIEKRDLHKNLKSILAAEGYEGYVSIEMGKTDALELIDSTLQYVEEIF